MAPNKGDLNSAEGPIDSGRFDAILSRTLPLPIVYSRSVAGRSEDRCATGVALSAQRYVGTGIPDGETQRSIAGHGRVCGDEVRLGRLDALDVGSRRRVRLVRAPDERRT